MLTGIMYVLVPMPYLFFGSAGDSYGYGSLASGCAQQQQQQPNLMHYCSAAVAVKNVLAGQLQA